MDGSGAVEAGGLVLSQCPRLWLDLPPQGLEAPLSLSPAQHHYLERVRRLRVGDPVLVVLAGQLWQGTWKGGSTLTLDHCLEASAPPRFHLHLGIGIPKQGMDDLLYTLTELGVARITPLISERTIARPEAGSQRCQRWQRICQEAAEQSEHLHIPDLDPPTPLGQWLANHRDPFWIGTPRYDLPHVGSLLATQPHLQRLTLLTGPEGGWSENEQATFARHGGIPCSLGREILRAVTAPVVVASLVKTWWDCRGRLPEVD